MKKITSISTHSYEPISYGDNYLYTQYEKLRSFLQVNFDARTANFIAKPVISNSEVSWYANYYTEFKPVNQFDSEIQGVILSNYWELLNRINLKVNSLRTNTKGDQKEWYSLLNSVFDSENNKIFSDGQNVVILWGWKFFNAHENKLPSFIPNNILSNQGLVNEPVVNHEIPIVLDETSEIKSDELFSEEPLIEDPSPILEEVEQEEFIDDKKSFWARFLDFLKWFASKFWWLLLILLLLILLLFGFNSCEKNRSNTTNKEIEDLNNRIEYLRQKTSECCGCELNEIKE